MVAQAFLGLDVGSTTAKLVLSTAEGRILEARYQRHGAAARRTLAEMVRDLADRYPELRISGAITGSAALGLSEPLGLPFVQEVVAGARAVSTLAPETDVAIELGGEDAKVLYLKQNMELRMNEACAGGTGAFIDQMAALLHTDAAGLDRLAAGYTRLYPIASRCGVFAKTDIVPLLNEGAAREDLAASIFQAVVEQTISGLACGQPIRGHVAFLGGPLHFLPELRRRFIETLQLTPEEAIVFPAGQFMVALGTALSLLPHDDAIPDAEVQSETTLRELAERAASDDGQASSITQALPPLFEDQAAYDAFRDRHNQESVPRQSLDTAAGPLYLGVDLGSTTVKTALIDAKGTVLASSYQRKQGDPLTGLKPALITMLEGLPDGAYIQASAATGYGAQLAQAAINADWVDVETVAHLRAACSLMPEATYVIDIGGQDMKCLKADKGVIAGVTLNEACSAGCGAFLETFARSLGLTMEDFVREALFATHPVDLGSRCTVFMNSKVKQAQKEGATIGDIAAGLCYAVIKNALYKVLRLRSPEELGAHVLVQGGSFLNDALLRVMERLLDRPVYRPDIAGLMGAYGAALIARDRTEAAVEAVAMSVHTSENRGLLRRFAAAVTGATAHVGSEIRDCATEKIGTLRSIVHPSAAPSEAMTSSPAGGASPGRPLPEASRPALTAEALRQLSVRAKTARCSGCGNHCLLTVSRFSNGRKLISGNRCERGSADEQSGSVMPNLYAWKMQRLFDYTPLPEDRAPRGSIGIPRVLNMYERYPFWFTLFTKMGFRVELSPASGKELYDLGLSSMPSQTVCYPAKLAHGHVTALIRQGVRRIFYPCIPREEREDAYTTDCYSCPVVSGYPEVLRLNTDELYERGCILHTPFVSMDHDASLVRVLVEEFDFPIKELTEAIQHARRAQNVYRKNLQAEGERVLRFVRETGTLGIVLAGRPYHADPAIHHGLPELIASLGAAVLSEDSIAHLAPVRARDLRVVDQWMYHSRLYRAARLVCRSSDLELVQLTSFGCGLDAITADQVAEQLHAAGKMHTLIKIDEGASLGAARIRIRSLLAAVQERRQRAAVRTIPPIQPRAPFTRAMRKTHTILAPQMSPLHFDLLEQSVAGAGYNIRLLPAVNKSAIETGLNLVHNDACYPALVVIGQLIQALQSGDSDPARTAFLMAQTCGPCRATNYPALLRKALANAGYSQVPILSITGGSLESQPGFQVNRALLHRMILASLYGDMLQRVSLSCKTHELHRGATDDLLACWQQKARRNSVEGSISQFKDDMAHIVRDFSAIPRDGVVRPRVGIVGEILLKYHPDANNHVVDLVRQEGGEPVLTDMTDFFLYCLTDPLYRWQNMGGPMMPAMGNLAAIRWIEHLRDAMRRALAGSIFMPVSRLRELTKMVRPVVSLGNQAGEGWLLTAEMLELIQHGVPNVLCLQPFGCLPNHITGKGVLKELKRRYPAANLAAIDYDPGSSEANQVNRIRLFMSLAHNRLAEECTPACAAARVSVSVTDLAERLRSTITTTLAEATADIRELGADVRDITEEPAV